MTDKTDCPIARMFAAIDSVAWDRFDYIFTPDVAYFRPGYPPLAGLDQLRQFYTTDRVIARGIHRLECVIGGPEGEMASWGHFTGVTRTGEPVTEDFSEIYRIVDGRVASRRTFFYRPAI